MTTKTHPVINEYFENGIKITVLEGFKEIVPRNSQLQKTQRRNFQTSFAQDTHNQALKKWCNEKLGRIKALAEHSPYSQSWFEKRKNGAKPISDEEYKRIIAPAIHRTEQTEKLHQLAVKYAGKPDE